MGHRATPVLPARRPDLGSAAGHSGAFKQRQRSAGRGGEVQRADATTEAGYFEFPAIFVAQIVAHASACRVETLLDTPARPNRRRQECRRGTLKRAPRKNLPTQSQF